MDKIDKYINFIYRDVNDTSKDTQDLKQEMSNHLIQTVKELMETGLGEEESTKIAIERFGGEFQIRTELSHVVKFQKYFAKSILIISIILLIVGLISLKMAIDAKHDGGIRISNIMNAQIRMIEDKLKNEGIDAADKNVKGIFQDVNNNEFSYITIKEMPQNFDLYYNNDISLLKAEYIYPKEMKNGYYYKSFWQVVKTRNTNFILEVGTKAVSSTYRSSIYGAAAILSLAICWVLWIIWSIINTYRIRKLNIGWYILLVLTSIFGYFIILMVSKFSKAKFAYTS
jgi:hypothetical protein